MIVLPGNVVKNVQIVTLSGFCEMSSAEGFEYPPASLGLDLEIRQKSSKAKTAVKKCSVTLGCLVGKILTLFRYNWKSEMKALTMPDICQMYVQGV